MAPEKDRHHLWFSRAEYSSRLEQKLRRQKGYVIPTLIAVHHELHAKVEPPPKPNHHQIAGLLEHVDEWDITPVHSTIEYFEACVGRAGLMGVNAAQIADNLSRQAEYLYGVVHE